MADIKLRSYQEILGLMAAKLMAQTDLTDISQGSVFLTLLEAAASSDFSTEGRLLQLLSLRNIDKAAGIDLENLAYEMGLNVSRIGAEAAVAKLTVSDSAFEKVSTNIYAGSVSPAAGDTELKVIDASKFDASGKIYIGRGTQTSESILYISVQNTGSYWKVFLASPLAKDHLVGEEVVLGQGDNRVIPANSKVSVSTSIGSPISFSTLIDVNLMDGEDTVSGILAVALNPGTEGNVGKNKINQFTSLPWTTAEVTNLEAATGGKDVETDAELRQRIKNHVHNLGKGTQKALTNAVIGIADSEEGKRIVSAFLREPASADERAVLFVDDGTGFSPSYSGIGEETIVTKAIGTESFFQLQKWPVVKAQVASVGQEPFNIFGNEMFYVEVDGEYEERALPSSAFKTPGVALAQEVAEAINKTFTSIEARAKDGKLFITPTSAEPDYIRVGIPTSGTNANYYFSFPVSRQYTIRLYKNDKLLEKNGNDAAVQTVPYPQWPALSSSETLQLNVDGILGSILTLTDLDFAEISGSNTIQGATVVDWAAVINKKFIGVTASSRDDGTFVIKSNKGKDENAYIEIVSGSLKSKIFNSKYFSRGKTADYKLNRLLGQIELAKRLDVNDELKAGTIKTTGYSKGAAQAVFDLSATGSRAAEIVIVPDATSEFVNVAQFYEQTFTVPQEGIQKITGRVGQYANAKIDDWCHIYNLFYQNVYFDGLYKIKNVAADGSYIELFNPSPKTGTATLDVVKNSLKIFRTLGVPQVCVLPIGTEVAGQEIVNSINSQIVGAISELTDANEIKIYSSRLTSGGGLSLASICGKAINLGLAESSYASNDPHTASIESADLTGTPTEKITIKDTNVLKPYTNLSANGDEIFDDYTDSNRGILTYLGASAGYIRQPLERDGNSTLSLRDEKPYQSSGLGKDMRATKLSWAEFGQEDNMVFLIDNDVAKKTFDIPLYIETTIAGEFPPSKSQFDLKDSSGAKIGSSQRWLGHRFEDYRVWFQARAALPSSTLNSQLKVSAVPFGPIGSHMRFGIFYPSAPASESEIVFSTDHANASFYIDPLKDQILIQLMLASGDERLIGLESNKKIYINGTEEDSYCSKRISFLHPVNLNSVVPGDIINVSDPSASLENRGEMKIDSVSNLVDGGLNYEFATESVTATITQSVDFINIYRLTLQLESQTQQQLMVGDLFKVTGIKKQIQSVFTNSISKKAASVGLNEITIVGGGSFKQNGGSLVIKNNTYTYTSYNANNNKFTGVSPDPSGAVNINDDVVQNNHTIVVPTGGNFKQSDGQFNVNGINFTYDNYFGGKFEHISPDPTGMASVGNNLIQDLLNFKTIPLFQIASPTGELYLQSSYPNTDLSPGSGYVFEVTHKCLTIFGTPKFRPEINDIVQVGSSILRLQHPIDENKFIVDQPFSFKSLQSGILSRIYVEGKSPFQCINEEITILSSKGCQIYELPESKNKVLDLKKIVNETAGVKDLVLVSDAIGSNGTGSITKSTQDELMNGESYVYLKNSESFIKSTGPNAPSVVLKEPLEEIPFVGDRARLIPSTAQNIYDHFSRKQITGLTIAANVDLVDNGKRIQVSSKTIGGMGQVFAVGGRGSGSNILTIRGSGQEISENRAQIEFDRSAVDILATGHTVKLSQTGKSKKKFTAGEPVSSTTLSIQKLNSTDARITFSVPFVSIYNYSHSSSVTWAVRKIGRNRMRYEVFSGMAQLPEILKIDDWVFVGNGDSYAGENPAQVFSYGNQGWFQVLETDNNSYFDVENNGIEEFVEAFAKPFVFTSYHSARPNDQVVIGSDLNVLSSNKGTFTITKVNSTNQVEYINKNAIDEDSIEIGSGSNTVYLLDQGYTTYRKIVIVNPKPNDPTNRAIVTVSPGRDISLLNEGRGAKLTLPNRLGFGTDPVPGMSGYQFWIGLKRKAQRVVDGYEPDTVTFPGTRASGVQIEVREPQIQRVSLQFKIKTTKGVSLQALTDTIKSAITGYINSLGLGQDVVLSECIKLVQGVLGVDSVILTYPSPSTERITINSNAIARISSGDIILS